MRIVDHFYTMLLLTSLSTALIRNLVLKMSRIFIVKFLLYICILIYLWSIIAILFTIKYFTSYNVVHYSRSIWCIGLRESRERRGKNADNTNVYNTVITLLPHWQVSNWEYHHCCYTDKYHRDNITTARANWIATYFFMDPSLQDNSKRALRWL